MRVFFSDRVELLRSLNEGMLSERFEILRLLNESIFLERVELLRSLNEGIFRRGLSYSNHSMRVSKFAKCEVV